MGIAFSHCDFGISYGSFAYLCQQLAREAGIDLKRMNGHGGSRSWDELTDPLVPLLSAMNEMCGAIPTEKCLSVKRRIEELASRWSAEKEPDKYARQLAFALANGMAKAAFLGEDFSWF